MKKIVEIDGTKVLLDTDGERDFLLFSSHNNTGPNQNRWVELHAHIWKTQDRKTFYLAHYSQWQGERCYIEEMTLDDACRFAQDNYSDASEQERSSFRGYGLLDEGNYE